MNRLIKIIESGNVYVDNFIDKYLLWIIIIYAEWKVKRKY